MCSILLLDIERFTVLCVSIVALTTSLTYAYFVSQVGTNEQEKITIRSGDLALTFRDNDETVENIEGTWNFGDTIEKELVIENTGTKACISKQLYSFKCTNFFNKKELHFISIVPLNHLYLLCFT